MMLSAITGLFSCSKEAIDIAPEPSSEKINPESAADYLQLQSGNYWVFESYSVNEATGETIPLHKRDSLYVLRDTTINRADYHILEGTRLGEPYRALLRTSGPELLDADGRLLFATTPLNDTTDVSAALLPEGVHSASTAVNRAEKVKVPYGIFDGLVQHHFYYLSAGQDGLPDNTLRHDAAYYAKGIGLIQYSSQLEGMSRIEMRLRACRVQ